MGTLIVLGLIAFVAAIGYSMSMRFDLASRSRESWQEIGKSEYLWRNIVRLGPPGAVLYHAVVKRKFDEADAKRGHRQTVMDDVRGALKRARGS